MNRVQGPAGFSTEPGGRSRIAVIGSGISGASAAFALAPTHDVTLFEACERAGGHTCTVDVDYDGVPVAVDVGFIVYNARNYPLLTKLFAHLGVAHETTNMSFALSLDGGRREWCGQDLGAVFAQKRNLVSPGFLWMLREILRFNRVALKDREAGLMEGRSIGDYLVFRQFSARFRDDYLIPMAAAIWSTPKVRMLDFPARSFVNFFENHRLLEVAPPIWQTVSGGSRTYLTKLLAPLGDRVRTNAPVLAVERPAGGGVVVTLADGTSHGFDSVIIATHSDQARAMLGDPDRDERSILEAVPYRPNRVVLHRDASFMPKRRKAWAAWNYLSESAGGADGDVCVTYWMNRLQNISMQTPLFVTLNPVREPAPGSIFGEWTFDHPQFDAGAFAAQQRLTEIQGRRSTWFAGAWTGFGFHEDGLRSGLAAAQALGARLPWDHTTPDAVPLAVAAE